MIGRTSRRWFLQKLVSEKETPSEGTVVFCWEQLRSTQSLRFQNWACSFPAFTHSHEVLSHMGTSALLLKKTYLISFD